MQPVLFVSDLHLAPERSAIAGRFFRFLREEGRRAAALYILGDLFERWLGDDEADDPFNRGLLDRLGELAGSGVELSLIHGNRDFLFSDRAAARAGVRLIPDATVRELFGVRTLLMHGDTLCTDDREYQAFRQQVRNPKWQQAILAQPLEARVALAKDLREKSDVAKQGKSMEIMDVTPATGEQAFTHDAPALMIHGHTHRPARHVHHVGGRDCVRRVLPDWYEGGGYLEATPNGLSAIPLV